MSTLGFGVPDGDDDTTYSEDRDYQSSDYGTGSDDRSRQQRLAAARKAGLVPKSTQPDFLAGDLQRFDQQFEQLKAHADDLSDFPPPSTMELGGGDIHQIDRARTAQETLEALDSILASQASEEQYGRQRYSLPEVPEADERMDSAANTMTQEDLTQEEAEALRNVGFPRSSVPGTLRSSMSVRSDDTMRLNDMDIDQIVQSHAVNQEDGGGQERGGGGVFIPAATKLTASANQQQRDASNSDSSASKGRFMGQGFEQIYKAPPADDTLSQDSAPSLAGNVAEMRDAQGRAISFIQDVAPPSAVPEPSPLSRERSRPSVLSIGRAASLARERSIDTDDGGPRVVLEDHEQDLLSNGSNSRSHSRENSVSAPAGMGDQASC